jgi:hypothetical protein
MASIAINVIDANHISLVLSPRAPVAVTLDRGVSGVGIASISGTTISGSYYLVVTYTNGATQNVGPFALTGTVAAGSTTQIQYNSGGALAGSANLTWNGSALGVGGAVNATGAISATSNISTSGAAAWIGASSGASYQPDDGVFGGSIRNGGGFYITTAATERMRITAGGDVGIGTTAPDEKLSVAGNIRLIGNRGIIFQQSTGVAVGNILFRNGIGVTKAAIGSYYNVADEGALEFIGPTGSTNMLLNSSGNLGIGTTSPYAKLHVTGTIKVATGNAQGILGLGEGGGTTVNVGIWRGAANAPTTDGNYLNLGGYDGIVFATGAAAIGSQTERMRLDSSGNLGLGVTPSAWGSGIKAFQMGFAGSTAISGRTDAFQANFTQNAYDSGLNTWVYLQSTNAIRYSMASGQHQWYNAPSGTAGAAITFTQAMTLDAAGQLGVSVTPSTWASSWKGIEFQVGGSVGSFSTGTMAIGANNINNGSNNIYKTTAGASTYTQFNGSHAWYSAASGTAGSTISWSVGMQMNTSGVSVDKLFAITHATGTGGGVPYINFSYAGTTIGSITQSGTTAVLYNTTSDYRLKNNARPLVGSGEFIDALKPTTWEWSEDGRTDSGFLAHEFQNVSPYSVNGDKDAQDEEGNAVYQSMQASSAEVIANLVAEIQDLRKRLAVAGL